MIADKLNVILHLTCRDVDACYNLKIHFIHPESLAHFCAIIISTSNRTLSRKSFVVFIGFQPSALPLSALQRELVPSQVP